MSTGVALRVPHVVAGRTVVGTDEEHSSRIGVPFSTPRLDLDELVLPRTVAPPAANLPIAEILDFLAETGRRLDFDENPYLAEALEAMVSVSPLSRRLIEHSYRQLADLFDHEALGFQVAHELGAEPMDSWSPLYRPGFAAARLRAYPSRLVHVMAGNGPGAAAVSILRSALTKSVSLFKLPSNDLYTATAILRTMADIDPDHPTVRSFSAVYWRGGDEGVESTLFRAQYFDKLVAWGGESTIRSATRYLGPGFELVQYDPKVSISMIGREVHDDERLLAQAAELAAIDTGFLNQDACVASRFHYVEGDVEQVDRYCAALVSELGRERDWTDANVGPTPVDIRDNVEMLRYFDTYRIWGSYDGTGLVVRSPDPVDFHPTGKTVVVVPVQDLTRQTHRATVATQTVGVFPAFRKAELRDALAASGVQRIVTLGKAMDLASAGSGLPHDGSMPLQRLVRWVSDED